MPFAAHASIHDSSGQGTLDVVTKGTLDGTPNAVTYQGTSTFTGTMHLNVSGIAVDQPVNDEGPLSGGKLAILGANCDEIDGSFAPSLATTARVNGIVVDKLDGAFTAFRNGDKLPADLDARIQKANQDARAFESDALKLTQPQFVQRVGQLLAEVNGLYTDIYDVITGGGCDASGSWASILLPAVSVLFVGIYGVGTVPQDPLTAGQLQIATSLAVATGYFTPAVMAEYPAQLHAPGPDALELGDLDSLHQQLAALATKAAADPSHLDTTTLREVYATAEAVGFGDIASQAAG